MRPLLLIFTLALPLAACGGGDDFNTRVDRATADLQRAYAVRIAEPIDDGDAAVAASRLEAQAKLLDKAAHELPTSGVPDVAKHALAMTVEGLHKRAANRRQAARTARAGDLPGTARVLKAYEDSAADSELTKGYDELASLG